MEYVSRHFLLSSQLARTLYHEHASALPIIDYHNHLDAKEIWLDSSPHNLTQAWINRDHYVWRAMRWNGIDEHYITGEANDEDKFYHWCKIAPKLIGNPLYQWSHLELKRYFNCDLLLNEDNWQAIWQITQTQLKKGTHSARKLLQNCSVTTLCTTDSPSSDLHYHAKLASSDCATQVLPTFRADELFIWRTIGDAGNYLDKFATLTQTDISSIDDYLEAIETRINTFNHQGCRLADLGLKQVAFHPCSQRQANKLFGQLLSGNALSNSQRAALDTYLFVSLGRLYHKYRWTMQLHIGVLADVNKRCVESVGSGSGFSIINDQLRTDNLAYLLNALEQQNALPKTILYNLNPAHNAVLASLCGAFQANDAGMGKIQFGAAWWFNDHKDGMEAQLTTLKNTGALGCFIGMLTDSRNLFSMSRHEYFRRVMCNLLANWVEQGELPNDLELLQQTIENICYHNAQRYFNFPAHHNVGASV
ncbi:glucuronate isomerase [Aliagarivorans taiwanensis]|uniref:glucuronate isomerase n=1 Tax=Aliagarivorans taiwanensis TaxID=561966 RepID=UPI000426A46B|nr:glucuronate isomerase [Aliagarivorans taiwanensis]